LEATLTAQGKTPQQIQNSVSSLQPPPAWRGMPTKGTVRIPVFLVDFSDAPHVPSQTVADVQSKMFGNGNISDYPYESLKNYYQRSSYNQLTINGDVYGWYRAPQPRTYYQSLGYQGREALINEIIGAYNNQINYADYDADHDGKIDAVFIKWAGSDNGNFWWAYQPTMYTPITVDGVTPYNYVWSWYSNVNFGDYDILYHPHVDIHETGHLLGLPDYYDYDDTIGPKGGVGGWDMMDSNWGDHNAFSKYLLGWIDPIIISSGTQQVILPPSGTTQTGNAVLIMPGTEPDSFGEFFMVQYREPGTGNDPSYVNYDGSSLKKSVWIWHVDSTLSTGGYTFLYDNSYKAHKLLRLMEADGLEHIETGNGKWDVNDFYLPGMAIGPSTKPNTNAYSGSGTAIVVNDIQQLTSSMQMNFGTSSLPFLTVYTDPTIVRAGIPTNVKIQIRSAGVAVSGATVTLTGVAQGSGTSDINGNLSISVKAGSAGTITATASKTGYMSNPATIIAIPAVPIGGKIAFNSNRTGNHEIYAMNPDGTGQTPLTTNTVNDGSPTWSPYGSKIAFNSDRDGNYEIYVMNADGTGQTRLTTNPATEASPTWSLDGSKIAFMSDRDGFYYEIYIMNPDGTGQTRLTYNLASDNQPAWFPDGTKIAFDSNRDGNTEIYVMKNDGTGQTRITNNLASDNKPDWSPDGTKIAFDSNRDGNYEIYMMNPDGTGQTRITNNLFNDNKPDWSPDGSKISFMSDRDGNDEIYVMNKDGTGQTRLTTNTARDALPDFGIMPASIIITSPNGGESYIRGQGLVISWSYTGDPGQMVEILLLKETGDMTARVLTQGTSIGTGGTGSYIWYTSPTELTGNDYHIKITSIFDPTVNDTSDAPFTIMPSAAATVTATVSPSAVVQGDKIFINGTAEGQPSSVAIWILGKNFAFKQTVVVNVDGSFSYEITQDTTNSMNSGQYSVVVQHPGINGIYDIDWAGPPAQYVYDYGLTTTPVSVFKIYGPGSLQGSDAAEALTQAILQPYIDDTSIKLQFVIESSSTTGVYRPGVGFYLKMDMGNTWTPSTDKYLAWDNAAYDLPIAGDWNMDGRAETGVYRPGIGFYLKMDNGSTWNPSTDKYLAWDNAASDLPIAGDWNMDGRAETGVYRPGVGFYLKMDNGSTWNPSTDQYLAWDNAAGDRPIAGDWNMDGRSETGVYRPGAGFYLKMDNSSTWSPSSDLYLAWDNAAIDRPVAGDWNADGRTETGVYRPGVGFYLKMDNGSMWNPSTDKYLAWDNAAMDLPIAGNFV
jgi:M6 family metalloprotease-like protein